jgi:hypothetical protein
MFFSGYPKLATRLVRTSQKMNEISLLGNCNLSLSNTEMKSILKFNDTSKKAIFRLHNYNENDDGIQLTAFIFTKMPLYQYNGDKSLTVNYWYYSAGFDNDEEEISPILSMDEDINNENNILSDVGINRAIDSPNSKITTLDVKSLYKLYSKRISCLTINNYANIKTLEIFNEIVNKLSSYDHIIIIKFIFNGKLYYIRFRITIKLYG